MPCARQPSEAVGDDRDGYPLHELPHSALRSHTGQKEVLLRRDQRRGDAAQEVHTAEGEAFQGEVARLGAVDATKEVDRVGGGSTFARETEGRDGRVAVAAPEALGDLEVFAALPLHEEVVDAAEPGTRERGVLDAHVAVV